MGRTLTRILSTVVVSRVSTAILYTSRGGMANILVNSVWTHRRTDRTCAGKLYRAGERYLVGVSRPIHDPNERLPGITHRLAQ